MENSVKSPNFSLKTELSLGLPGSESPERKPGSYGVTIFGKDFEGKSQNGYSICSPKSSASGAKRGFSDAIDGCEKWVFSINGNSDPNLSKDGAKNGKNFTCVENNNVPSSPKPVQDKQPQLSAANELASAPAAK